MDQHTPTIHSATRAPASATAPAHPQHAAERGTHPYTRRFERPLPPAFAAESTGMTWRTFCSTYAPENGPLRLRDWNDRALGRGAAHAVRRSRAARGGAARAPAGSG